MDWKEEGCVRGTSTRGAEFWLVCNRVAVKCGVEFLKWRRTKPMRETASTNSSGKNIVSCEYGGEMCDRLMFEWNGKLASIV